MPKFRQTAEILRLMSRKESIRNVGIIAHIDHGKTTLTDSLLAEAGLLSPQIAGEARALDYLEEEQKRGITIKTANISLLHKLDGTSYVINLIDTPGHVDFTGKVTRALRAIDGAVVVVDAVEEIMVQTEILTRQALEERVKPVLFINKVDRLIKELKLSASEIQNKFTRIICDFNNLIEIYGEPEFKENWKVNPTKESVAFGSALHKWGFTLNIAKEKQVKINEIIHAYNTEELQTIKKKIPIHRAILEMIVKNIPDPANAQKYRVPKIWKGELCSEIGKAMLNCDDKGPTVICVTMSQAFPNEGLVATGRIFSGITREGDKLYLVNADKEYDVQQVAIYMGAYRENISQATAGNIAALLGLELARAGETIVDVAHKKSITPFERIKYISEPVVTIALEPKNPNDLPSLIEAMNRLSIEDPNILSTINKETGEYLLSGMGELHLETAAKFLKEYCGGVDIAVSKPAIEYRESVTKKGAVALAKTLNKQNCFWVQVEPPEGQIKKAWIIDEQENMLVDSTKDVYFSEEVKESIMEGFRWACKTGPLCEQRLRKVKVKLIDAQIHPDPTQRESSQIMRAVSRAIFGSFLTAEPVLVEPVYKIEVSTPTRWLGICANIITSKRGKIQKAEQRGTLTIMTGYIPVAETFGLTAQMRSATSGHAIWQSTFDHWEKVPKKIAEEIIKQIRTKKGLPPEIPKPEKFIELP